MMTMSSNSFRSNYNAMSALAHETGEPVYITKNGDVDLVVMSTEALERRCNNLEQRAAVLEAEVRRLAGETIYCVSEARAMLKERHA